MPPDSSGPAFRLLGAVEVSGAATGFVRAQHRDLLALLLLHADRLVSVEQLVEDLWGGRPPGTATAQVQNMVSALRGVLRSTSVEANIESRRGCYALRTDPNEIDVDRFEALLAQAVRSGPTAAGGDCARAALALWRGQPLADVRAPFAERARLPLVEQRAQAYELLFEAELAAGRPAEILPELGALTAEFPFRERLLTQWLTALYRAGRRIEALEAYRGAMRRFTHDYGLEPGPQLRELELRMLRGDPLDGPTATPVSPAAAPSAASLVVPDPISTTQAGRSAASRLPGDVAGFVGRTGELTALDELLAADDGTPVVAALTGTAGVGKTALALHWARRVASAFPEGQLYIDLRGYDPSQPVATEQAVAVLLRALGSDTSTLPDDLDERAARYRGELAGRRVLVLLDNAASTEQVRALMPGDGASVTVVTSRDGLAGLVARHGARRIPVGLLPPDAAYALLGSLIGERVRQQPEAAAALAAHCAHLPLALRVAAEFLASHPTTAIDTLVAELDDRQRRLELLDAGGDERTGVHSVLSWSYRHLDAAAARGYRHFGLHPGYSITVEAMAALVDSDEASARALLGTLGQAHLVEEQPLGRFRMHDLLRAYAQRVASDESTVDAHAARTRLVGYYLAGAAAAMDQLFPHESHRRPAAPPGARTPRGCDDAGQALAWLDAERENLVALAVHVDPQGRTSAAGDLSRLLWRYLDAGSYHDDALLVHGAALQAARELDDPVAEGSALTYLGVRSGRRGLVRESAEQFTQALKLFSIAGDELGQAESHKNLAVAAYQLGEHASALEHAEQALRGFRAADDHAGLGLMLGNLGVTYAQLGRFPEALDHFEQALQLHRQVGNQAGEGRALVNIGEVYAHWDRREEALQWQQEALQHFRHTGDRAGEAAVLRHIGDVLRRSGRFEEAVSHHQQSLAVARELTDRHGEAESLDRLGAAYRQWGRPEQAAAVLREALVVAAELGDRSREVSVHNGLGEALAGSGDHAAAAEQHARALALAEPAGDRYEQARARTGLGRAAHAAGRSADAVAHFEAALATYDRLGMPEAEEVRALLDAARPS